MPVFTLFSSRAPQRSGFDARKRGGSHLLRRTVVRRPPFCLLRWLRLLEHRETGPKIRAMFDHVLVDEYQDTNACKPPEPPPVPRLTGSRPNSSPWSVTCPPDGGSACLGRREASRRSTAGPGIPATQALEAHCGITNQSLI
jgi:hypothetical protein